MNVQYPAEWFKKKIKPAAALKTVTLNLAELGLLVVGGLKHIKLTLDTALAFLYMAFKEKPTECREAWTSFGIEIGAVKEEITPWNIVTITDGGVHVPTEIAVNEEERWELPAIIMYVLCLYRIAKITNTDYRDALEARMCDQIIGMGGKRVSFNGAANTYGAWVRNPEFCKVIAAIDMYLYHFKSHEYAPLRIGTLGSRYKDCAGLNSMSYAGRILGKTTSDLFEWMFVRGIVENVNQMVIEDQETCVLSSYFPYQSDMGIVDKSAYSAVANTHFFHWVHLFGSLLGHRRSQNARFTYEGNLQDLSLSAILLVWAFSQGGELAVFFSADGTDYGQGVEAAVENSDLNDETNELWKSTTGRDPKTWFILCKVAGYKYPECVKKLIQRRQDKIEDCRPGTIGEYAKKIMIV